MKTTNKPLNVGMIGVANFGGARRKYLRETGLFQITACTDRNPSWLERAAAEESAVACGSFEELLEVPEIDAIVISTGATTHANFTEQAMLAGKHVFVEKPLCCSVAEVSRLRAVQRETGRVVGVGHHQNDSDPIVRLIRQYLGEGKIGQIAAYEENSSHSGGLNIRNDDWRGLPDRNPGGMLFQCGVHAIHTLNALFGPISEVQAMMRHDVHQETGTADVASVLFRHADGMVGTLNCYHVTAYCHELRVFGTRGNLYIDTVGKRAWYQEALYGPAEPRVEVPVPSIAGSETANLRSWYDAIHSKGMADPGLEEGAMAVLPVFAAEEAARQRRAVTIRDFADKPAEAAPPTAIQLARA